MLFELLIVIIAICCVTIPVALSGVSGICLASVFFGMGLLCLLIALYWSLEDYDDRL